MSRLVYEEEREAWGQTLDPVPCTSHQSRIQYNRGKLEYVPRVIDVPEMLWALHWLPGKCRTPRLSDTAPSPWDSQSSLEVLGRILDPRSSTEFGGSRGWKSTKHDTQEPGQGYWQTKILSKFPCYWLDRTQAMLTRSGNMQRTGRRKQQQQWPPGGHSCGSFSGRTSVNPEKQEGRPAIGR